MPKLSPTSEFRSILFRGGIFSSLTRINRSKCNGDSVFIETDGGNRKGLTQTRKDAKVFGQINASEAFSITGFFGHCKKFLVHFSQNSIGNCLMGCLSAESPDRVDAALGFYTCIIPSDKGIDKYKSVWAVKLIDKPISFWSDP